MSVHNEIRKTGRNPRDLESSTCLTQKADKNIGLGYSYIKYVTV
jgi:hypothetical protein